ncbi:MAG: bacterial transcriptional activator domain-containing protein [Microvirga sp.]
MERALDAADREPSSQVDLATALLNLDPTHEGACRILMEDHAAHGDTAGALRVYKALWDLLDEEYDSEPSDQTKDLVVRIKTGEFKPKAPAESAESVSPEPSPGPSAPLSKALASGNVLPSEPAVPAHNLLIVSEFDSRGVGERPGSAHGLARRGLGPCGADLPVDHRRGAAFRPGLYRARPPQELGAPGPSRPRSQRGGAAAGARAEQGRRRGRPLRRPRAPLLRLVLGARAPVRPGRAELRPRPRAQRERPLDAHLERLGDGLLRQAPRGPRARRSGAPDRPQPVARALGIPGPDPFPLRRLHRLGHGRGAGPERAAVPVGVARRRPWAPRLSRGRPRQGEELRRGEPRELARPNAADRGGDRLVAAARLSDPRPCRPGAAARGVAPCRSAGAGGARGPRRRRKRAWRFRWAGREPEAMSARRVRDGVRGRRG